MFEELGNGVFRRRYESLDLNIGVVIGEDGVLLVDTRASHRQARELADELKSLTDLPVRWVVNTHWHWDHTFGNAVFDDALIWGHELCVIGLDKWADEMKSAAKAWLPEEAHAEIDEVEIVLPTETFAETTSIQIGRDIELSYHGLAHTDADIVVRVPDADVAFFGDLVEESAPPSFADSYPITWPLTLRLATEAMPRTIVPGHGDLVDHRFVIAQLGDLTVVADLAGRYIEGEIGLDEGKISGPYAREVMESALRRAAAIS